MVCRLAGSSLTGARLLIRGEVDIAINWCGGWHHAQKDVASGFCYVNDIVLCIIELRQHYQRVAYIDLDVHHGDGVENAFLFSRSVLTVSLHLREDGFFPGTGGLLDVGYGEGRHCALNIPYKEGFSDNDLATLVKGLIAHQLAVYQPDCLVIQCGGDSLALDKLGGANLSIEGYQRALQLLLSLNRPTVLLGGGGYMRCNVARLWTTLTATALATTLHTDIPEHPYFEQYGPSFDLSISISNRRNMNTPDYIEKLLQHIRDECSEMEKLLPRKALRMVDTSAETSGRAPCYSRSGQIRSRQDLTLITYTKEENHNDFFQETCAVEENPDDYLQNTDSIQGTSRHYYPEYLDERLQNVKQDTSDSYYPERHEENPATFEEETDSEITFNTRKNCNDWNNLMHDRLIRNWFTESCCKIENINERQAVPVPGSSCAAVSPNKNTCKSLVQAKENHHSESVSCSTDYVDKNISSRNVLVFTNSKVTCNKKDGKKRGLDSDVGSVTKEGPRTKIFKSRSRLENTESKLDDNLENSSASSEYDFPDFD
uniref:Histone deacetylase 8 n=1 Tax=Hirondellea gigas TaxID=1518452 RepID=A0A2P2I114_9CRUS